MCKWPASVFVNVRCAGHDFRAAAIDVDFDRVHAARSNLRLSNFELVVAGKSFLKAIDGDIGEVPCLRVEPAGIARYFPQTDFEGMVVGLGEVEREDADASRLQRLSRGCVNGKHPHPPSAQPAQTPPEEDQRLRSWNWAHGVAENQQRFFGA